MNDPKLLLAQMAFQRGDAAKAKTHAEAVFDNFPQHREAGLLLAKAHTWLGGHQEAVRVYRAVLDAHPGDADALIGLANAEKGLGNFEAAYAAISDAIKARPDDPLALNVLGLCAYYLNRGDEALAAFDRALSLEPNVAALYRHRGLVLVGLSRHTEARESFEYALRISPDDVASLNHLASLHLRHDRPGQAAESARKALTVKPNDPEALFYLARATAQLGDAVAACKLFEQACQSDRSILTPFAIWLIEEGKLAEAHQILTKRLEDVPRDGMALHYLIETQGHPATEEQAALLFEVAEDRSQPAESQAFANYSLGKVLERQQSFESAFEAYRRANERFFGLKLAHVHDLVGTIDQEVADAKRVFDRETIARLANMGNPSSKPIFIIGMIRSGTTLVEQIVSSNSQVHPAGELRFWMENGPSLLKNLEELRRYADAYLALIARIAPRAPRVTDKMPLNLRYLGLLASAFPNAKFIWCRRDPLDTCFSVYATPFTDPPIFSYNLRNIGYVFRKYAELMDHWLQVLPPGRVFEVHYEHLVTNQEAVTRSLLDYCGLPFEEACLEPERNDSAVRTPSSLQVRKPVYRSSVARWKNFEPWLEPLKEGLGPDLAP